MKNILITGASSGIGERIARDIAPYVDNMMFLGRSEAKLFELISELKAKYPKKHYLSIKHDLSESTESRSFNDLRILFEQNIGTGNQDFLPNCVVYSAGEFSPLKKTGDISEYEAHKMFQTNLHSLAAINNLVLEVAKKVGYGRIVYIGSVSARKGSAYGWTYAASKAAGNAYVLSLHNELENESLGDQIKVYSLNPGFVSGNRLECRIEERMRFFGKTRDEVMKRYEGKITGPETISAKVVDIFKGTYAGEIIEK